MKNARLAVLTLSLIGGEPVSIHEVSENTGVIIELLESFFVNLKRESIIEYDGEHLSASQEQRMKLAIRAVN